MYEEENCTKKEVLSSDNDKKLSIVTSSPIKSTTANNGKIRARSEPNDNRKRTISQPSNNKSIGTVNEESEQENTTQNASGKCARFNFSGSIGLEENSSLLKQYDESEWELVPPDGGWGWLILFGSMLVNILVPGTVKSFGVLFNEFLDVFEASPAAAAWIPALCYFLYSSLGPLSSILSVKYSYRTVTILGGTFAAVGMILSFWASSVTYLYFSYGILVGTGAGLSFPPTVYIVTSYFVKLRGLANGLCISGSALGSIILPPVLRLLLEYYGYRGAILIMGGITLNVWVGAIFYHPVEEHMKRVLRTDLLQLSDDDKEKLDKLNSDDSKLKFSLENEKLLINNINSNGNDKTNNIFVRSASSAAVQNFQSPILERTRKISMPMPKEMPVQSAPSLNAVPEMRVNASSVTVAGTYPTASEYFNNTYLPTSRINSRSKLPIRSPSTSSFNYVSTPYHGSTLSTLHPEQFASSLTLKSITFSPCKLPDKNKDNDADETTNERNKYFDITLLKDPIYLIILISNSTNAISYTNFIILLPTYATLLGFDKSLSAYLISVVSAFDLIGRIGGSALSDLNLIPKTWYFIGGLFISGISLALLPTSNSYIMICICCAIFGLASGIYVGITAIIMADMLGEERLTSTYGISLFVNGILQLIGPPLCGVWYEVLGSYKSLFFSLGIILIVGASIWSFVPIINRNKNNQSTTNAQLISK